MCKLKYIPEESKARIVLLVDLREKISDLGAWDEKKQQKHLENDQLAGHFQSFF